MSNAKVVFVGAGSFVFGPTLIGQCVLENKIAGLEWSLYDLDYEAATLMAKVGEQMAKVAGIPTTFQAHRDLAEALADANFVVCSAAVQQNRRFETDRKIINEVYPGHLISEFGGVYGISCSLRQMTMMSSLAATMSRVCPDAWLLDISNPLPRVCQVASEAGIQTVGFCSVSICGLDRIHQIFGGPPTQYPYTEAQRRFEVKMGGTNHLSWLVELTDKQTGQDLLPELRTRLLARKGSVRSKCEEYGRRTGYLLMSGDSHVQDFLPIDGLEHSLDSVSHGTVEERNARLQLLSDVASGQAEPQLLTQRPSWERPSDFIEAMVHGQEEAFSSLNLANKGQIPQLPKGAFVETAATIKNRAIEPTRLDLPNEVLEYSRLAVEINLALFKALQSKSLKDVYAVVDLDPTIVDKEKGKKAVEECLRVNEDVIGEYRL